MPPQVRFTHPTIIEDTEIAMREAQTPIWRIVEARNANGVTVDLLEEIAPPITWTFTPSE